MILGAGMNTDVSQEVFYVFGKLIITYIYFKILNIFPQYSLDCRDSL